MESPLVTIVTPNLNQGRTLRATIDSVLAQDYARIEYLVMDGGSTDGSLDILRACPERVAWLTGPDGGQAAAINAGFRKLKGEILAWLNADDLLEPNAVSSAVRLFMAQIDVALVYGDAIMIDNEDRFLGECAHVEPYALQRFIHEGDFIVQPAAFFRRSAFEAVGGLDEALHWTMDYDLWIKLGGRFKACYWPERWARYRWTGENKTAGGGFARFDEIKSVAMRHGARGLPAEFRLAQLSYAAREGLRLAKDGHLVQSARSLLKGVWPVASSPRVLARLAFGRG
ncbi:MAG: glycosyltransferase [Vicinamibacteria bacterium]|jgi:glycosyltransferase involved in cell wall biosynthesis|nr:glycosyltransferase [Vicinamibacteria bacterium]